MKAIVEKGAKGEYLDVLNDFIAFHANAGRIRDNIINIYLQFGLASKKILKGGVERIECSDEHVEKMKTIFDARNIVLHGSKIPVAFKKGFPQVAIPIGKSNKSRYAKNQPWEEMNSEGWDFMAHYLKQSYLEVLNGLNSCLQDIKDRVHKLCDKLEINIDEMVSNDQGIITFSGPELIQEASYVDASGSLLIISGATAF